MTTGEKLAFLRKEKSIGYFFLAASVDDHPRLRPLGMIYSNSKTLFIATDRRKDMYSDLTHNSQIEIAAYNALIRKWIRISGNAEPDDSLFIKDEMMNAYPALKQKYLSETEMFLPGSTMAIIISMTKTPVYSAFSLRMAYYSPTGQGMILTLQQIDFGAALWDNFLISISVLAFCLQCAIINPDIKLYKRNVYIICCCSCVSHLTEYGCMGI